MNKYIAFMAAVTVAAALIIGSILLCDDSKKAELSHESSTGSSSSETLSMEEALPEELEEASAKFKEILFDAQDTMRGQSDYFEITSGQMQRKINEEYLRLEPVMEDGGTPLIYYLGHQIYESQENGERYIISGNAILPVSFTADYEGNGYMREESTGRKIHLFGNASDVQHFKDQWEAGQRILSGETLADCGTIIFDGQLTDYRFTEEYGTIYFNLSEIAPLASDMTYYDVTMGYIDVYVNDFAVVRVPTTAANHMMKSTFEVVGDNFKFYSWNGKTFEAWGPVLDAITPKISIEDASMMFGWRFYTNGDVLSIVTDPLNATNLAAVRDRGDMGIILRLETMEDGLIYLCAYDSNENLIWSKPYDESMEEQLEVERGSLEAENATPEALKDALESEFS